MNGILGMFLLSVMLFPYEAFSKTDLNTSLPALSPEHTVL